MEIFFISDFQHTEHAIQCSTNRMWLIEWALNWQKTEVQTEKKKWTDRKMDQLTDRKMDGMTDRQMDILTGCLTGWLPDWQRTVRPLKDRQANGLAGDRQTDRWTDRQVNKQTGGQTDRQMDRQKEWWTNG